MRKIETVKHVEEIAELLASFFDREGHKNAAPETQGTERVGGYGAHDEAFWKEQGRQRKELWLREHPGRTGKDYHKLMGSDEMLEWRKAKGRAESRPRSRPGSATIPARNILSMSAGCRTASISIARAGAGSGSGASEDPSTRLCLGSGCRMIAPALPPTKKFVASSISHSRSLAALTIVIFAASSRGRIAKQLSTRCGSPWMSWGISHNA